MISDILLGLGMGLVIGAGCRWFDVPLPAPPKLVGALLVVAMTTGFLATDYVLNTNIVAMTGIGQ
ncbi:DUF1427 family protein [uncultured Thalassospira sp.]|jgi:XapX domain-containing protein|uniref:DUF1427 family protein n=1 Tax=uncultured Thalassospira sp. TaxID=404382 RepID=UPI0030D7E7D9|tara:strand:+ start:2158 stop:2352 length:195 start_codon:yes stop_codon:yes gene_type:complete